MILTIIEIFAFVFLIFSLGLFIVGWGFTVVEVIGAFRRKNG